MNTKKIKRKIEKSITIISILLFFVFLVFQIGLIGAECATNGCCDLCEKYGNASDNISVNFPIIITNKTVNPKEFEQGDLVKFHIEVLNIGNAPAYKIKVEDILNENLDFVNQFDSSNTEYLLYKYVFNVSASDKYECQQEDGSWTINYTKCVPKDTIKFSRINNKLTFGRFGNDNNNYVLPVKTAIVIEFFARAKENASIQNFTNNASVEANYVNYDYDCSGQNIYSCQGGICESSDGQSCTTEKCYCSGCSVPPAKCTSTKIKQSDYSTLNLNITPNLNASTNFTITSKTEIYITKIINSSKNKFEVGDIVPFKITISKNTNEILTNVTAVDYLPYGLEFVNATLCNNNILNETTIPSLIVSSSNDSSKATILNFNINNLTNSTEICVNVKILDDASNAYGALKNVVNVSANNERTYETKNLSDSSEVYFYIQKKASLKISKRTLTQTVIPNSIATYEILVINDGGSNVTDIKINDTLPCGFKYILNSTNIIEGTNGTDYENFAAPNETTNPIFTIEKILPEKHVKFTFNVSVPPNASGMCENYVKIEGKDKANNTLSVNDKSYAFINVGVGYLQVNKEVVNNKYFEVGENVVYRIKVRNSGSVQSVNNVLLKDFIPKGMDFVNITFYNGTENVSFNCDNSNITNVSNGEEKILQCNIGNLNANETKIYYLTTKIVNYSPSLTNKVEVNGTTNNGEQWFKDSFTIYIGKPKLKLTKTADKTNAKPGESVDYTLNVSNIGDATAYNISIKDVLPINWKGGSGEWISTKCSDGSIINVSTQQVRSLFSLLFNKTTLPPGVSCKITYEINIPDNTLMGLYNNNARVNGKDGNGNPIEENNAYTSIFVKELKEMDLIKIANTTIAKVGENVTFTITVRNNGNVRYNVTLDDYLPYGFITADNLNYSFELQPGVSRQSITIRAKVTNSAIPGLNANCVVARAFNSNGEKILERKDCAFVYVSSPSIDIKKWTLKSTLNPGENATFFVKVRNRGTEDINNLQLHDELQLNPQEVSISTVNCSGNITIGNYPNLAYVNLTRGEECTINYTFKVPLNASGLYQNIVYAIADNINESDKAYINVIYNPKFEVYKIANVSSADINEKINFSIFISNEGNVPLNLSISDILPKEFENLSPIKFTGVINPSETKEYNVIAKPKSNATDSENCVEVNATTPKKEILSKNACSNIHIKRPLLLIQKWTTIPSRLPNQIAEFYVLIKNDGEGIAKNVKVSDESNLTNPTNVLKYQGNCDSLNISSYPNLISNGTLNANQYCIISYNMTVPAVGGYTNIATLNATDLDNKDLNVQKSVAYVLASGITPSFSVEKYVSDGNIFAERGTYKNFTVKVKNLGNVYINITNINETVPYGFDCTIGNWSKTLLEPGEEAITNITCYINKSALAGINVNEVRVWATGNGGVSVSQSDNEIVIVQEPKLKLTKTTDKTNAKPGETVFYTLNISNIGDATAYNISIKDVLPENWKGGSGEWILTKCSGGSIINVSTQQVRSLFFLLFNKTTLPPGVSCKITYKINVPSDTKTGLYNNNVNVVGKDRGGKTFEDNDKKTTYIKGSPILFVTLKANATYIKKGETVNFIATIENLGDVDIGNIKVNFTLPPGFKNLTSMEVSGLSLGKGAGIQVNVIAKVLNDTNATIAGAHVARVYVEGTSYGGIPQKAESYTTVYITSTPLSLVADMDEKTLFIGSHAKFRFIIINPSMFDTQEINLTVELPNALNYNVNSTMFNGIPLLDNENNGIVKKENDRIIVEWKNLSVYAKSIGILTFSALVTDDVSEKIVNSSIFYNQHGEIGEAKTTITLDKQFVSAPFFYVFSNKEDVNINEPIEYKIIVSSFNIENATLKLMPEGLKILNENVSNLENLTFNNLTYNKEIKVFALPSPTVSKELKLNAILTYNQQNQTKILEFDKIVNLLIPPEGILTNNTFKNLNLTINLKDEPLNYTINLKKGWNLIGLPLIPSTTNLEEILKSINYTDVFTYNKGWSYKSLYMNKWFGNLKELNPGTGYWIKVNEDCNLTITGYEIKNFSLNLEPGWNLISLPTFNEVDSNNVDGDVFTYDNGWIYRSKYNNKWFGNLKTIEAGKGYWVKVETNKILMQ